MILLDTDHINVLQSMGPQVAALRASMAAAATRSRDTAITVEEQMRGLVGPHPPLQRRT